MINLKKGLVPFWDDYLIESRHTNAVLSSNKPQKRDIVMVFDKPLSELAGRALRFEFTMSDAEIFSMTFAD